jgi:amidase
MRIHAFTDDALSDHDAVALAELVASGERSPKELADAAYARLARVTEVNAVADTLSVPRETAGGRLHGVPTFIKDNVDVRGMRTGHGSEAFTGRVKKTDDEYVEQYLSSGMTLLGKSRLPEFGFNATTEFRTRPPVRNPWNPEYSVGASSGGSAALVAAGVVPIAHANDGGGSIRIPAAAAGLVGLKPTRGRHIDAAVAKHLPINMVSEGVVTRSVRDTAAFFAAMEDHWRNPALKPVGLVEGPSDRNLRIGLLTRTVNGAPVDAQIQAEVDDVARLLTKFGHEVVEMDPPNEPSFADDFTLYWGMLATMSTTIGAPTFGIPFSQKRIDGLTRGLRRHFTRNVHHAPGALRRLKQVPARYDAYMSGYDAVLGPVLAHVTPKLGYLSPNQPFDQLMHRLSQYVVTTPLHNIAGTPVLSMPVGLSEEELPINVHLSGVRGGERTLLELAYLLEAERPRPLIQG